MSEYEVIELKREDELEEVRPIEGDGETPKLKKEYQIHDMKNSKEQYIEILIHLILILIILVFLSVLGLFIVLL